MPEHRLGALLTAVIAAAALAGCGGGGSASPVDSGTGTRTGSSISIKDFTFDPGTLQAKAGQPITVTNQDSAPHTITAKDKSFDSKSLAQGKTYTFTIDKPGTYAFF
ncbi:MAG: cupredoxin domain-containing protein, partial [Actinomycetota bacterium]|nr:cupredoxin domain-containing protein [Actinomycetota bacterium]